MPEDPQTGAAAPELVDRLRAAIESYDEVGDGLLEDATRVRDAAADLLAALPSPPMLAFIRSLEDGPIVGPGTYWRHRGNATGPVGMWGSTITLDAIVEINGTPHAEVSYGGSMAHDPETAYVPIPTFIRDFEQETR